MVKKIDLALQGGGSHGAYTWGVIDRLLDDERIEIDGICGTSAGAMNGICTIYGLKKGGRSYAKHTLVKFWHKISEAGKLSPLQPSWIDTMVSPGNMDFSPSYKFFSMSTENFTPKQLNPLKYNPLEKILNEVVDFKELQEISPPKLFVCATNVRTCEAKVFGRREITAKAILASACLPYMFEAVEIDGEFYWDGGYMGNPPIFPLITNTNLHDIVLIKINSINIGSVPTSARDIADRVNEISFNSSLINEMKLIHYRNELLRNGILKTDDKANREIFVHTISGYEALSQLSYSSKMNTSWEFLLKLKERGRQTASKWLETDYKQVGIKSTFDVEEHFFDKF